jgi:hypothetical protein
MILLEFDRFVSSTRASTVSVSSGLSTADGVLLVGVLWERESGRVRGDVGGRSGKGRREELGKAETLAVWDSGTLGGVARRRGTGDGGVAGRHGRPVHLQ